MILLNYNCGVTSYVLYLINNINSIGSGAYAFATLSLMVGLLFGQILFGIFGDTFGRKRSFQGSSSLLFLGSFFKYIFWYNIW
jgi:MFS family permease